MKENDNIKIKEYDNIGSVLFSRRKEGVSQPYILLSFRL
jgi:hypothetical protein